MTSRPAALAFALFALGITGAAMSPAPGAGPLDAESERAAILLRDRIAAGSRASDWVRELTEIALCLSLSGRFSGAIRAL